MKKLVLILIVFAVCFISCAAAEVLTLPPDLKCIEEEAFLGDAGVTEVVLPEGLEIIGARAFQGCGVTELYIPASVAQIGSDALPSGIALRCWEGSAAEAYASENGNPVTVLRREILSARMEDQAAVVALNALPGCLLRVELQDDRLGTVLQSAEVTFPEPVCGQEVRAEFALVPNYYILRAVLEDASGAPLGEPFILLSHMRPFEPGGESAARAPGEFSGTILDFGDNGFAALKENVKTVSASENELGEITILSEGEISQGDALYWPEKNELLVVRNVWQDDSGLNVVSRKDDAGLADFYQYIRYSATLDAAAALEAGGDYEGTMVHPRVSGDLVRYSKSFEYGPLTAEVSTGVSVTCDFRYDARLYGPDYMEYATFVTLDAGVECTAQVGYTLERELPLILYSIPTDAPGLLIDMDLTLPMRFSAMAEAHMSASFAAELGFRYDSVHGGSAISSAAPSWDMSIEGELTGEIGPRASVGVSYLRFVSASVSAQPGIRFEANTTIAEGHSGEEDPDSRHHCGLCFDVLVQKFVNLDVRLTAAGKSLFSRSFPVYNTPIFDGYLSMINDELSVHGGRVALGEGKCPNYQYRVNVDVRDPDAPGEAKQVRIYRLSDRLERILVEQGPAPLEAWLYPGDYVAESDHLGNPEGVPFRVVEEPESMILDFVLVPVDEDHFPDEQFRQFVSLKFDLDHDLLLDAWERSRVRVISTMPVLKDELFYLIHNYEGIEYFGELIELEDGYSWDVTLDLSQNTKVKRVACAASVLNVTGCTELLVLRTCPHIISPAYLQELDLSTNPALEELWIRGDMTHLDLSANPALKKLYVVAPVVQLDLSRNRNLVELELYGCVFDRLDLSNYQSLEIVRLSNGPYYTSSSTVRELDLSGCPVLTEVYCSGCGLTDIDVSNCAMGHIIDGRGHLSIVAKNNPGLNKTLDLTEYSSWVVGFSGHGCPGLRVVFSDAAYYCDAEGRWRSEYDYGPPWD